MRRRLLPEGSRGARSILLPLGLLVLLLLGSLTASAQTERPSSSREAARAYFNAGVASYQAGQFLAAGQAFLEAWKLFQRPQLLFSIAQAFRRQFHIDHQPAHLKIAVDHFRRYVEEVPKGGRRMEAAQALSELAPFVIKLELEGAAQAVSKLRFSTRIVVTSSAPGSVVSLNDGPPHLAPLSLEVKPGRYRVTVKAAGYEPQQRETVAIEGRLVALDVPLQGKPPRIVVSGVSGGELLVDGQHHAELPLAQPLAIPAGRHYISVSRTGHRPFGRELSFDHGATTHIDLSLPPTDQRIASYVVFGIAGATLIGSGITAAIAAAQESTIESVLEDQRSGTITREQRQEYNDAVRRREDLLLAAGVTAGVGGAIGLGGLLLYLLDHPEAPRPSQQLEDRPKPPTGPAEEPGLDVLAVLSPSSLGIGLRGSF